MTESVCPICYETIGIENLAVTPCNHRFHCNCLIEHAYNHVHSPLQCPVCRQEGLRINNTNTGLTGTVDASGSNAYVSGSNAYGATGHYRTHRSYGNVYYSSSSVMSSISNLIQSQNTLEQDSSDLINISVVLEQSGNTIANITRLRQTGDYGVSRMTDAFANSVRNL